MNAVTLNLVLKNATAISENNNVIDVINHFEEFKALNEHALLVVLNNASEISRDISKVDLILNFFKYIEVWDTKNRNTLLYWLEVKTAFSDKFKIIKGLPPSLSEYAYWDILFFVLHRIHEVTNTMLTLINVFASNKIVENLNSDTLKLMLDNSSKFSNDIDIETAQCHLSDLLSDSKKQEKQLNSPPFFSGDNKKGLDEDKEFENYASNVLAKNERSLAL